MTTQVVYSDFQVSEGDQIVTYSKEGVKCKRIFTVDYADNTDPQGTLWAIYNSGSATPGAMDLPLRGAPHPSIVIPTDFADNAFMADVFTIKAITSTQARVEVEYCVFNAEIQEPSTEGNTNPAFLTIAGSVQSIATAVDVNGNPLEVPYLSAGADPGESKIIPNGAIGGTQFSTPKNIISANIQFPTGLYRFRRRETEPRNPFPYVGFTNETSWEVGGIDFDERTLLCTRIESESQDFGVSYIVAYEFQAMLPKPSPDSPIFQDPADFVSGDLISAWDVGAYYVLPSGIGVNPGTNVITVQPNQTPPDAVPTIFQVYGTVDFNADLYLTSGI